jgi:hypothetical protein
VLLTVRPSNRVVGMEPDSFTLARLVSMAGLIAATIEYAEILRRRSLVRAETRERTLIESEGLRGLVRVLLAEPEGDQGASKPRGKAAVTPRPRSSGRAPWRTARR